MPHGKAKPYRGPRPFGPILLKHCEAARLLGVRPKALTQMNVKREHYLNTYVYDPEEIRALAAKINPKENNNPCPTPG